MSTSFNKLKNNRDVASRTGHSLALGFASLALMAQHSLPSIGEASGTVFRPFADSCTNMALQLLTTVPSINVEELRAVGRCCAALVSAFEPEIQGIHSILNI